VSRDFEVGSKVGVDRQSRTGLIYYEITHSALEYVIWRTLLLAFVGYHIVVFGYVVHYVKLHIMLYNFYFLEA